MTVKELMEILEHEIQKGHGDFKIVTWDTARVEATDVLLDSREKEFYICTEN